MTVKKIAFTVISSCTVILLEEEKNAQYVLFLRGMVIYIYSKSSTKFLFQRSNGQFSNKKRYIS